MLYEKKYPNATPGQEVETGVLYGANADNCAQCGRITNFVELNYQAHFCSDECVEAFDNEVFHQAIKK